MLALIQPPPPTPTHLVRTVARGVELCEDLLPDGAPGGPLSVHVLKIDPSVAGVRVEAALGQDRVWNTDPTLGREIVSTLAQRRGAVAGVNASFFPYAGNPIGLHVDGDDLITEPFLKRSSLVVTRGGAFAIGAFDFAGSVDAAGERRRIDGLNRKPGKGNELLVFTPRFGPATLTAPERVEVALGGVDAPLRPGKVAGVVRAVAVGGATRLERGTVVVSAGGAAAAWLKERAVVGAPLTLDLSLLPLGDTKVDPATIRHAVTGAPRIVTDGRLDLRMAAESVHAELSTTRHPRTAAGITKDGALLLMTVDGRQKGFSRGVTLTELANLLLAHGAVDAVNLDGGGSSACVVFGAVANSPSEGKERPVADALLVFADEDAPDADAAALRLDPPRRPLKVGESHAFALPNGVDPEGAVWGATGGVGFVRQDGLFRALRPGKGFVQVRSAGRTARVAVEVAATNP